MAEFRCFTKGNADPQSKPRVCFTAHPDDYRFFDEIKKDITDRQNCAIFYLDPDVKPDEVEDFELRSSLMQLLVVPVTRKLLTQPNRAMDIDIPFALSHHIPVLPLMQESGLDDLFSGQFGDLQYLDKYYTDPTAIPYDEKLTNYLESVIVGDELAEKVRAAFDAYIFLSYRKKDRQYAQELMKLIHQNPLCRDIAIWYDEFLTPGENFNDAIEAALKKSDLFALAVTPNLINEVNYILTTEYPMAQKHGKDILPVEMAQTERQKLSEQYKDIPQPISADDTADLESRLSELLKNVALADSSDPQHNYFIGLAYLSGIDVEVDHERAVELITGSAEAGCSQAIKKLVSMYQTGECVQRDYYKAIEWQKILVERLTEEYEKEPDLSRGYSLIAAIQKLGDCYYGIRALEKAKEAYTRMCELCGRLYETTNGFLYQRRLSVSYHKLGDVAMLTDSQDEALQCYEKGLEIAQAIAQENKGISAMHDLSQSYNKLGNLARVQYRQDEALEYYQKALKIREKDTPENEGGRADRDISLICINLGNLAMQQGRLKEACEYFEKALAIREAICQETQNGRARRDLSVAYKKLGDIALKQGRLREAKEYCEKALAISEALAQEAQTVKSRQSLSSACNKLGDIALKQGELREAKEYYEKALAICEALAREVQTVQAERDLSYCYVKCGNAAKALGRPDEARGYYEKGLQIDEAIAQKTQTVQNNDNLAVSCYKLGVLEHDKHYLQKALDIWTKLSEQCPSAASFKQRVAIVTKVLETI